ncbi:MAG TPA: hypothetical protein VFU28_09670, partial [Vicinamibacterales bacterium]|nr:hypothetical protein [Vicinamibacterales bacterium]
MRTFHFTWTLLLFLALPGLVRSVSAQAQQVPPVPAAAPASVGYTVFLRGTPIGHQDVMVRSDAQGLVISGQGQIAAPINVITRRVELRYGPNLDPQSLAVEARVGDVEITLNTAFDNGSAVSKGMQGPTPIEATDMVAPLTLLMPNVFLGSHAVLARRLGGEAPGTELKAFVGPGPGAQVVL